MPQNFYELVWIFIIYAFIGWCTEVSYAALDRGIFVNRGFLNGPYCPIYGCGVVIVVAALTPLKDNLLILFAGSFLLTSILEYITGFILEKVFHNKWWDYSNKPFNLHGYICLKFSIYWGLACTFIMDVIHPIIYKGITMIPHILGVVDADEVLKSLGKEGSLDFVAEDDMKLDKKGNPQYTKTVCTGKHIKKAEAGTQQNEVTKNKEYVVELSFNAKGTKLFADATKAAYPTKNKMHG